MEASVAPVMFQLIVLWSPWLMLDGLAVKELMAGLAGGVIGAAPVQPTAAPTTASNDNAVNTRNHLCEFTFTSII
jgi:hypothetical protein